MRVRYFIATEGPLHEAMKQFLDDYNTAKRTAMKELCEKTGCYTYLADRQGHISGLVFNERPDPKYWKRVAGSDTDGWAPKRNTNRGKEISTLMRKHKLPCPEDTLTVIGAQKLMAAEGNRLKTASVGFFNNTALAEVPIPEDHSEWEPQDVEGLIEGRESEFLAAQGR